MNRGLLKEHDNILHTYRTKKEQIKECKAKGDNDTAKSLEFYTKGIAYVYTQIFQTDIENANFVSHYEFTKTNHNIWKQN